MKKTVLLLMVSTMLSLIMASCATGGGGSSPLGRDGIPMPDWVKKKPKAKDVMYFVGRAESQGLSSVDSARFLAREDAKTQLGLWVGATVDGITKSYTEESGERGNTQALLNLKQGLITRIKANTAGWIEDDYWVSATGTYFLLVEYSAGVLKNELKKEFGINKAAIYAEYKADLMYEEIEKGVNAATQK